ncbi:LysE family translocator [Geobacter sp. FeAm09]|uniref:LysE family translocator n=1 Tax=Geobacter sp. FeAm09 TaxID=2597769 RepID=UPI0011EF3A3A|nr:LysE family transporter [Geobacter sp. FeAm09]QEM66930.1 LysE family translocator [Geobacter sp. FeAm09]
MQEILPVLGISGAIAIGAMSPGPSFLMVARTAVAASRPAGLAAALGMGVGGALFAVAALAGLQAVFAAVPGLYLALKVVGGLYLVYLGQRIWRGAGQPLALRPETAESAQQGAGRAFLLALGTQVSNPKAAIVYGSVFAAFLPRDFPLFLAVITVAVIFMIEAGWYALVALVLSAAGPRAAYLRYKVWIDRSAGGVMAVLGIKLVASARQV